MVLMGVRSRELFTYAQSFRDTDGYYTPFICGIQNDPIKKKGSVKKKKKEKKKETRS